MVYNAGTVDAFLRWGNGAQTATTSDVPIPAKSIQTFSKGQATTLAVITSSGTTTVLVSLGLGE